MLPPCLADLRVEIMGGMKALALSIVGGISYGYRYMQRFDGFSLAQL